MMKSGYPLTECASCCIQVPNTSLSADVDRYHGDSNRWGYDWRRLTLIRVAGWVGELHRLGQNSLPSKFTVSRASKGPVLYSVAMTAMASGTSKTPIGQLERACCVLKGVMEWHSRHNTSLLKSVVLLIYYNESGTWSRWYPSRILDDQWPRTRPVV